MSYRNFSTPCAHCYQQSDDVQLTFVTVQDNGEGLEISLCERCANGQDREEEE